MQQFLQFSLSANFTNFKKVIASLPLSKCPLEKAHSYTLNRISKYVRKSLATPRTPNIFATQRYKFLSQVENNILIDCLKLPLSKSANIFSENYGKLFLKFSKNSKILNLPVIGVKNWHKSKNLIIGKFKNSYSQKVLNFLRKTL